MRSWGNLFRQSEDFCFETLEIVEWVALQLKVGSLFAVFGCLNGWWLTFPVGTCVILLLEDYRVWDRLFLFKFLGASSSKASLFGLYFVHCRRVFSMLCQLFVGWSDDDFPDFFGSCCSSHRFFPLKTNDR